MNSKQTFWTLAVVLFAILLLSTGRLQKVYDAVLGGGR